MRIEDPKTVAGYFWLPSSPEKRLGGTLSISDGGNIQIEVVGNFDQYLEDFPNFDEIQRILGVVESLGCVTLDHCLYTTKSMSFGSVEKSTLDCDRAFVGLHFEQDEPTEFDSVCFSVEGLDEWLGVTGIKVNRKGTGSGFSLTYERPSLPEIDLGGGFILSFRFSYSLPGFPILTEAAIRQKAAIVINSNVKRPLDDFIGLIHKITDFLVFGVDKVVSVVDLRASIAIPVNDRQENLPSSLEAKVIYQSLPFSQTRPKIAWHDLLFRYQTIQADPSTAILAWLDAYNTIGPPLDLYFAAITNPAQYLDSKFLFFAIALETWHRRESDSFAMDPAEFEGIVKKLLAACPEARKEWLEGLLAFANEVSLAKRLKELLKPFEKFLPEGATLKRLIRQIVDTRNYLMHYNPSLEGRAARGRELCILVNRMEAFLKLLLLRRIGFDYDQVKAITKDNRDFQYKIKMINKASLARVTPRV
ncbi:MAG TPA: hypothetical protein PLI51_05195 [bacterium]|nr:hypothetical protein [bacterium]